MRARKLIPFCMEDSRLGVVLDSNVWIAFLNKEDSQHGKATKLMLETKDRILVPEYVLIETASVLKNYKRTAEAIEFVRTILKNVGIFLPSNTLAYETGILFCERKDRLSFTDSALLVLSKEYRVVTFDRELERAIARERHLRGRSL